MKPFKSIIRQQFEKHLNENLQRYADGKVLISERRILTTEWVANAWSSICNNPDVIKRGFKKCGYNLSLDGSENDLINIEGLPEYTGPIANANSTVDFSMLEDGEDSSDMDDDVLITDLLR